MGNAQSNAPATASPSTEGSGETVSTAVLCSLLLVSRCQRSHTGAFSDTLQTEQGAKLYTFQQTAAGGHWDLLSASADVNFYNINEDTAGKKAKWHLEIGTDVDIPVSDQFSVDLAGKRVTVAAEGSDVYAVKFPSTATLHLFEQEYNHKLFENTYEMEYNVKNKDQVMR